MAMAPGGLAVVVLLRRYYKSKNRKILAYKAVSAINPPRSNQRTKALTVVCRAFAFRHGSLFSSFLLGLCTSKCVRWGVWVNNAKGQVDMA